MLEIVLFILFFILALISIIPWFLFMLLGLKSGLIIEKIDNLNYFELMNGVILPFWVLLLTILLEFISVSYIVSTYMGFLMVMFLGIIFLKIYKKSEKIEKVNIIC